MDIEYTVQIWQEKDQFVAHAMPLDVMSSGPTPASARSALTEAVELFLATAADMGTLEIILEESGYEMRQQSWASPFWVSVERQFVTIAN